MIQIAPNECPACKNYDGWRYTGEVKSGLSAGKAVIGGALLGPLGAIAGAASGKHKYRYYCTKCGFTGEYDFLSDRDEHPERFPKTKESNKPKLPQKEAENKSIQSKKKEVTRNVAVAAVNVTAENAKAILDRIDLFLEDKEWDRADAYCEQFLNYDPHSTEAYIRKLLIDLELTSEKELANQKESFEKNPNYIKALRFATDEQKKTLQGYIKKIEERKASPVYYKAISLLAAAHTTEQVDKAIEQFSTIQNYRDVRKKISEAQNLREEIIKKDVYTSAKAKMEENTEEAYKSAADIFRSIKGFQDADSLVKECLKKADDCHKDDLYESAKAQMVGNKTDGYEAAIRVFSTITGWKDSDEQIDNCRKKIEEIKAREETARLEQERRAEEKCLAKEKQREKLKKAIPVAMVIAIACIVFVIVLATVIMPKQKYNRALSLLDEREYDKAYELLEELGKNEVIQSSKYDRAIELLDEGKYDKAYMLLKEIGENEIIQSSKYDRAIELLDEGEYDKAYTLLKEIGENEIVQSSKYDRAVEMINEGDLLEASRLLEGLDYKDSNRLLFEVTAEYNKNPLRYAPIGSTVMFGSYEQNKIEWMVLDKKEDRMLLLSTYALDSKQFNNSSMSVTWENSSIREWLNDTFLNKAFNEEEKSVIIASSIKAEKNPLYDTQCGNDTVDKVFLLSISESQTYLRQVFRQCAPTDYAKIYGGIGYSPVTYCYWWLRTSGNNTKSAAVVNPSGIIYEDGYAVDRQHFGVRPAIWIDVSD